MSSRERHRQSGDFDESGDFGSNLDLCREPNLPDSCKSPLCWCPSLELIRSNHVIRLNVAVEFVILAKLAGFVKIAALSVPFSRAHSI